jgi:hypothetical protein
MYLVNCTSRIILAAAAIATGLLVKSTANAGVIPYAAIGTENSATYTFTAVATGDIIGYFAGSGAGYSEEVAMSVNGGAIGSYGLHNHTTAIGASFNFGSVTAGDTLRFFVKVYSTGYVYSSDTSLNSDGKNHVYSTSATAGQAFAGSPAGTYVAFEDLHGGGDFNYRDNTFVFTNVSNGVDNVPDGATTTAMLGAGFVGLTVLRRKFACA